MRRKISIIFQVDISLCSFLFLCKKVNLNKHRILYAIRIKSRRYFLIKMKQFPQILHILINSNFQSKIMNLFLLLLFDRRFHFYRWNQM